MDSKKVLIELQDVKKFYPIKSNVLKRVTSYVKAVNGVSFELYQGETLGVVGESGCGKSTLGRSIIQLEDNVQGNVIFNGQNLTGLSKKQFKPFKKEMQMIFQDPFASLNPRQRIGDAIEEPLVIHTDLNKKQRSERVRELLNQVGLKPEFASRYPHEFSGGQRQRIGIGRAIALNPELIICDEPVSALDVSVQAQIIKLLQKIQQQKQLTYIFISHDLSVVNYICDRVLVMYLGHMVELAPAKSIYKNPTHPYTEALLSAIPRMEVGAKRQRIKIAGEIPSPSNLPTGCPFHTRCPHVTEVCKHELPEAKEIDSGHFVYCHNRP